MAPDPLGPQAHPPLDPSLLEGVVLPLLAWLERAHRRGSAARLPLLALNGPVGAGKTSLARVLERLAPQRGLRLAVASIDDLYLPWAERRRILAGNPFGVWRVPPGSHDIPLLLDRLEHWRRDGLLRLPRFDKRLAGGQGERSGWWETRADALVLEGWLMGCRALGPEALRARLQQGAGLEALSPQEQAWLPRWDRELAAYGPLWEATDGLWLLRPQRWSLPRRWRLQAEARQRRAGGGWMAAAEVERLVRASLCSLPPALYQDPLLLPTLQGPPLVGAVLLDARRRCCAGYPSPQPGGHAASGRAGEGQSLSSSLSAATG